MAPAMESSRSTDPLEAHAAINPSFCACHSLSGRNRCGGKDVGGLLGGKVDGPCTRFMCVCVCVCVCVRERERRERERSKFFATGYPVGSGTSGNYTKTRVLWEISALQIGQWVTRWLQPLQIRWPQFRAVSLGLETQIGHCDTSDASSWASAMRAARMRSLIVDRAPMIVVEYRCNPHKREMSLTQQAYCNFMAHFTRTFRSIAAQASLGDCRWACLSTFKG